MRSKKTKKQKIDAKKWYHTKSHELKNIFPTQMSLTIHAHSDKHIVVRGDKDEYAKEMKRFQGRWNSRLKDGEGWLVPVEFESALRAKFDIPATEARPRLNPAKKVSKSPSHTSDDDNEVPPPKITSKTAVRSKPQRSPSPAPSEEVAHETDEEDAPPTPPPKPKKETRKPAEKKPVRQEKVREPSDDENDELVSIRSQMKEVDLRLAKVERERAAKRK